MTATDCHMISVLPYLIIFLIPTHVPTKQQIQVVSIFTHFFCTHFDSTDSTAKSGNAATQKMKNVEESRNTLQCIIISYKCHSYKLSVLFNLSSTRILKNRSFWSMFCGLQVTAMPLLFL